MRAPRKIVVALPADLLPDGESIGSLVELSDDNARIGFQESDSSEKPFSLILIELQTGQTLRVNRGTEAIARSPSSAFVDFEIVLDPESGFSS